MTTCVEGDGAMGRMAQLWVRRRNIAGPLTTVDSSVLAFYWARKERTVVEVTDCCSHAVMGAGSEGRLPLASRGAKCQPKLEHGCAKIREYDCSRCRQFEMKLTSMFMHQLHHIQPFGNQGQLSAECCGTLR